MTQFDNREKAFEAKYRLDQETAFKVHVRRNKLVGLWAARLMGLSPADAEAYAKTVVEADFAKPGDDDVIEKLMADFAARGIEMSDHRLRKELDRLVEEARNQVLKEAKPPAPESI